MNTSTNDSSPEAPWSVGKLSELLGGYIDRLGAVWVEAEITQWGRAAGNIYGKLSDPEADAAVSITVWRRAQENIPETITPGDRVIALVKPSWWVKGGTLAMNVLQMRHTGLGEILEKLEKLKATLGAEGLFAPELKKPLPFLPRTIGLVTGKDSDAEKDVLTNAKLRWPDVEFRIVHAAMQGDRCVTEVIAALTSLDSDESVDIIVVARGGGDFLNLLPFSDERLVRHAAALSTPLVSAIGHEADRPLLDEVADLRASTPTDAAKRIVPDVAVERAQLDQARARMESRLRSMVDYEFERLAGVISRPVLSEPITLVDMKAEELLQLVAKGVDMASLVIERATADLAQLSGHLRGLSPQNTLDRGYAIARKTDGSVISRIQDATPGIDIRVTLRDGDVISEVKSTEAKGN
jgi:exodeoxyribonuclease VII large subunit